MPKSITIQMTYDHPVDKVWRAITDHKAMSQWLMPCDIEPIVGHKFQFRTKPYPGFDGIVHCEVLKVVPRKLLSFSWRGGSLDTIVTFELTAKGDTTVLDFEQSGFEGFLNKLIVRRILSSGWKSKIITKLLPKYLAEND